VPKFRNAAHKIFIPNPNESPAQTNTQESIIVRLSRSFWLVILLQLGPKYLGQLAELSVILVDRPPVQEE